MKNNTCTSKDIAENFNSHFVSVLHQIRNLLPNLQFDISTLQHVSSRKDQCIVFSIPQVTSDFVYNNLMFLKSNKAMGIDKLSANILKTSALVIDNSISKIMNWSIESGILSRSHHFLNLVNVMILTTIVQSLFCLFYLRSWKDMFISI